MKRRQPRKKDQIQALHSTYALADAREVEPDSGTTIPTEFGVKEAKDWVDHNQK